MNRTNIIISVLVTVFIVILIFLYQMMRTRNAVKNTPAPTTVVPTRHYSSTWQDVNSIEALKTALTQPTLYQGITIEYRPRSNSFIIFHTVPRNKAQLTAEKFFLRYGVNIRALQVMYLDLNPITVTNAPPPGFGQ